MFGANLRTHGRGTPGGTNRSGRDADVQESSLCIGPGNGHARPDRVEKHWGLNIPGGYQSAVPAGIEPLTPGHPVVASTQILNQFLGVNRGVTCPQSPSRSTLPQIDSDLVALKEERGQGLWNQAFNLMTSKSVLFRRPLRSSTAATFQSISPYEASMQDPDT